MKSRIGLLLIVAVLVCAGPLAAAGYGTTFARMAAGEDGRPRALQLAIVSYAPAGAADYRVDLISAVHIADPGYYAELNQRFREYDALLYELVASTENAAPVAGVERAGFIAGTQVAMTAALGLSFQLDEIDYRQDNFVHADLSPQELKESMHARGESLYVYFWRIVFAAIDEYARDPLGIDGISMYAALFSDDNEAFKIAVAHELLDIDRHRNTLAGESGSAVIDARNDRALQVLQQSLDDGAKRIGIFYGVAHMPDFEQRLVDDFGLEATGSQWLDAWTFSPAPTTAKD